MGNNIGRRRQVVDEKYTRQKGLYQHRDIDHKKLRKLILDSKLAPCYPGDEDCSIDLEECPICFLYYPSLNRSRCCMKGICTECFLQMKPPHSTRPTQCPFCKTSNYVVEYRGVRTKEEKGIEQVEVGCPRNPTCGGPELGHVAYPTGASPSGGLTCTVAALSEHQHISGDSANGVESHSVLVFDHTLQQSGSLTAIEERAVQNYPSERWIEVSPDSGRAVPGEEEGVWSAEDHGSEVAEAGTSYASSDIAVDTTRSSRAHPEGDVNMGAGHLLPESFEEQMMLAMAVSLADARARTSPQGMTWM